MSYGYFRQFFTVSVILFAAMAWPLNSLAQLQIARDSVASESPASAPDPSTTSLPHRPIKAKETYLIGDKDILAIDVWHEAELSRAVPVRPDGKISVPLLGEVQASGLTPDQLQANLTDGLRKYLTNPEVTVIVQEARSQFFNVVGEVMKPGAYILGEQLTVLDAIALAGGFRDFASQKKIYVLRARSDGSQQRIPFNYKEVIKGHKVSQNILLQPRDTVVVP
jgi:polysaccharide biosynthesis/export protein